MFDEVLLNRAIFVGVTFFVLIVGAQLYRWHVRHEIAATLARKAPSMRRLENRKAQHITGEVGVLTEIAVFEISQMYLFNDDTQTVSEETEALPRGEVSDYLGMVEVFLHYKIIAEAFAEADPVSPFSFGPYPEVLPEYPNLNLSDYTEALYELKEKTYDDSNADERRHSYRGTHWKHLRNRSIRLTKRTYFTSERD